MFAVYYASYRHLTKMAARNAGPESKGNPATRMAMAGVLNLGGYGMLKYVEWLARRSGLDIEKAKTFGVEHKARLESVTEMMNA